MKTLQWFKQMNCEELTISKFNNLKSKKAEFILSVKDKDYITSLQISIQQLPTEGDMMVDMSEESEFVSLDFKCGSNHDVIEFYEGSIKTPATSFYVRSNKLELPVWNEIKSLWSEQISYSNGVTYFVGLKREFPDFYLTYLGKEDKTPPGTTATSIVQNFEIQDRFSKNKIVLEVHSGQVPPKPVEFNLGKKKFTLHTYLFEKERLQPRQLVVTQSAP